MANNDSSQTHLDQTYVDNKAKLDREKEVELTVEKSVSSVGPLSLSLASITVSSDMMSSTSGEMHITQYNQFNGESSK